MFCLKSAVQKISQIPVKPLNQWLIISKPFILEAYPSLLQQQARKMSSVVQVVDIPTWKEQAREKDLPEAGKALPGNDIDKSKNDVLAGKVSLWRGDITKLKIDAIVNAANSSLLPGGGVDGAIHKAAGPDLRKECKDLNGCKTGEAKIAQGYKLPAKYVILTVGPKGEYPADLKNCYVNSLTRALEKNLRTVAFPCISTGIYGYPNENASHVAIHTVRQFLEEHSEKFDRIIFCVFLDVDKNLYEQVLQTYFPV
ncbi:unnamed protein product [Ceutorhynchus assimilis]|uniref:Macro domain-containing protein n=1 Tax=Ceutorhynchus assimilis TaxID=467358 RepID=A0A9N9MEY1_9CUCU|nr:unnamed protein product [Ceutorhynchus assimilis]